MDVPEFHQNVVVRTRDLEKRLPSSVGLCAEPRAHASSRVLFETFSLDSLLVHLGVRTRCGPAGCSWTPPPPSARIASRSTGSRHTVPNVFKQDCLPWAVPWRLKNREQVYLEVETHRVLAVRQLLASARYSPIFTGRRRVSRPTCSPGTWRSKRDVLTRHTPFCLRCTSAGRGVHVSWSRPAQCVSRAPAVNCTAPASAVIAVPKPVSPRSSQCCELFSSVRGPHRPSPH